jgi:hypothetical protein
MLYILYVLMVLVLLEVALSFDNAVINARILPSLSPKWQRRFLTWGILFAVFVVRFIAPVIMVWAATHMSLSQVFSNAVHHPELYHQALQQAYPYIAAFGSAFLLMVALTFWCEPGKKVYWLKWIEKNRITRFGQRWPVLLPLVITVLIGSGVSLCVASHVVALQWLVVFLCGAVLQAAIICLRTHAHVRMGSAMSLGLVGFIYIELIDASFSLDGVVGAFAITTNIFLILIGLGIGALCIRAFTLYLVRRNILAQLAYLEHGAHYAIFFLALSMLAHLFMPVPEWVPGVVSVALLACAWVCSVR